VKLPPLTWPECEMAAIGGIHRRILALVDKRPAFYGFQEEDTWGSDIESAGSELAVAKFLDLYWTAWARRPGEIVADVGKRVQVRRRSTHGWNLITHKHDRDDHFFVLVYGAIPQFELAGWLPGSRTKEHWGDPFHTNRPAFWTPQEECSQDWDALTLVAE
jgi:hypothetical protein